MIRVVLAVLLAAALVGVSLPAVAEAARARAAIRTHATASELATTMARFAARNDPVRPGGRGATRVVTVRLPSGASLRVGATLRWSGGGRSGSLHVGVPVAVLPAAAGGLRGGPHHLRLGYVRCPTGPRVAVRRFKTEGGATLSRVPERGLPDLCVRAVVRGRPTLPRRGAVSG